MAIVRDINGIACKAVASYISPALWMKVKMFTVANDTSIASFLAKLIEEKMDKIESSEKKKNK
jgi:hypothetical protein